MASELGFVTARLVTTDVPTPTSPKLTVPGVTWTDIAAIGTATDVPQPDVITIKQHIPAKATAVNELVNPLVRLASQAGSLSGLREPPCVRGISN